MQNVNNVFTFVSFISKNIVILLIYIYRFFISPVLGNVCVYKLSCSRYCLKVFKEESFLKAVCLSMKRIFSCHPWNKNHY